VNKHQGLSTLECFSGSNGPFALDQINPDTDANRWVPASLWLAGCAGLDFPPLLEAIEKIDPSLGEGALEERSLIR
jgi:hypothetical protein